MIKLIENKIDYDFNDIYAIRIKSLFNCYGNKYPFAQFWCQQINNQVTAIISKLDEYITLSFTENADFDEIIGFANAVGFQTFLSSSKFVMSLSFESGIVMVNQNHSNVNVKNVVDSNCSLQSLFDLSKEEIGEKNFTAWYADFNHRIRHGGSKAYLIENVACGMVSSITENGIVISNIKTKAEFRHMGYGSDIVNTIINDFKTPIFLMREHNKNENFYRELGFINTDEWRLYYI